MNQHGPRSAAKGEARGSEAAGTAGGFARAIAVAGCRRIGRRVVGGRAAHGIGRAGAGAAAVRAAVGHSARTHAGCGIGHAGVGPGGVGAAVGGIGAAHAGRRVGGAGAGSAAIGGAVGGIAQPLGDLGQVGDHAVDGLVRLAQRHAQVGHHRLDIAVDDPVGAVEGPLGRSQRAASDLKGRVQVVEALVRAPGQPAATATAASKLSASIRK